MPLAEPLLPLFYRFFQRFEGRSLVNTADGGLYVAPRQTEWRRFRSLYGAYGCTITADVYLIADTIHLGWLIMKQSQRYQVSFEVTS
jgi:hypothetical protein